MEEASHFGLEKKDLSKIALEKVVTMSRLASDNLSKGVNGLMKKNRLFNQFYLFKSKKKISNMVDHKSFNYSKTRLFFLSEDKLVSLKVCGITQI